MTGVAFNKAVLDYFATHGIDAKVAQAVGVREEGGVLVYPYKDADGTFQRRRPLDGGQTFQPKGRKLVPWAPLDPAEGWLLPCEGESDFLAATSVIYEVVDPDDGEDPFLRSRRDLPPALMGCVPIAVPGAGACHEAIADLVTDSDCCIAFDGDDPGRLAAKHLKATIDGRERSSYEPAAIIHLPDGQDLSGVLAAADDRSAVLAELVAEAEAAEEAPVEGDVDEASGGDKPAKPTQSQILLALAKDAGIECWATPEGDPYVTVPVADHREHHRLGSRGSRDWLSRRFYQWEEKAPSAQALQDALGVLRGAALWGDVERREAHVRYAAFDDTTVYIDIGDVEWKAIEIAAEGWRIVADPPVRFRRPRGMLPLPEPERGGDLNILRGLLNVDDAAWTLIAGWLVGVMAPTGPYPVLALHGEQGAAKSSAARLLRSLVDPNVAPLRSEPRDERDLVIAASNGRIVALDNVSSLSANLSDALCRIATGGGFATRELYSDSEEIIFSAVRPTILTSIGEVTTRGDLLDRSILATLNPIPESSRLTEAELEKRWAAAAPVAFGALLDAASAALKRLDDVHLERLPRMADHARWVTAAEPALGWEDGTYMRVYGEARAAAVETALESSPITEPIRNLAVAGFEGSATALLAELDDQAGETVTRSRYWPRSARALSSALRRLAPDLRVEGVEVIFTRSESQRVITIQNGGSSERHLRQTVIGGNGEPDANDANDAPDANPGTHSNGNAPATEAEEAEVERLTGNLEVAA